MYFPQVATVIALKYSVLVENLRIVKPRDRETVSPEKVVMSTDAERTGAAMQREATGGSTGGGGAAESGQKVWVSTFLVVSVGRNCEAR